ncbi:5-oxoprolinase subunit PxpB [Thorsellia kenyensis]|uniref:5-oxoprolinase subunit PxpB n=1 Tax=Thorsellia kenyensis TaxID=1549888 RepID=A0ABV6CCR7_9GAMM
MNNKHYTDKTLSRILLEDNVTCYPLGQRVIILEISGDISLTKQQKIWSLASLALENEEVHEVVPGMNNLSIILKTPMRYFGEIRPFFENIWSKSKSFVPEPRQIEIPVKYGGQYGPDLMDVALYTQLTPNQVIEKHSSEIYTVFFLGFKPGFPYLGGMSKAIATPRKEVPRNLVPAGSVGIGGEQTGIYPTAAPGGWQLIGQTEVALFTPHETHPTLLRPGDQLKFIPVEVLT